jgi:hypothetical protein
MSHGVAADSERSSAIIGGDSLEGGHLLEGRFGHGFGNFFEERTGGTRGSARFPKSIAAVRGFEFRKGADSRQHLEFIFAELRDAAREFIHIAEGFGGGDGHAGFGA